jgi:hypothetical protein
MVEGALIAVDVLSAVYTSYIFLLPPFRMAEIDNPRRTIGPLKKCT